MKRLIIAMLACFMLIAPMATASAITYASLELYPSADPFFCAGKYSDHWKVDAWATTNSEVSFAAGPVFKGVRFGLGFGSLMTNDGEGLGSVNVDVGFTLKVGEIAWSSYNCNQNGQNGVSDFILARQWISYSDFPVGLIGHNRQIGEGPWEYYWGPYATLGDLGGFKNNRLCLTMNLHPTDQTGEVWTAWIMDF